MQPRYRLQPLSEEQRALDTLHDKSKEAKRAEELKKFLPRGEQAWEGLEMVTMDDAWSFLHIFSVSIKERSE